MNFKERVMKLQNEYSDEEKEIEELLLTLITNYQLFEPCRYLSEDEEWVNVTMISIENDNITQAMTIKKSQLVMIGIFNRSELQIAVPDSNPEDFYQ